MEKKDYHSSITANISPAKAFECISHVEAWWTNSFEGKSQRAGDVFTVRFGETFVTFKVTDAVAGKKVSWEVIDCNLHWLSDKEEWKGTVVSWEVSAQRDVTKIDFTHLGLVPEVECYENCEKGWNFFIKESLFKFITEGKGLPDSPKPARVVSVS
jgi:hypothetical protein